MGAHLHRKNAHFGLQADWWVLNCQCVFPPMFIAGNTHWPVSDSRERLRALLPRKLSATRVSPRRSDAPFGSTVVEPGQADFPLPVISIRLSWSSAGSQPCGDATSLRRHSPRCAAHSPSRSRRLAVKRSRAQCHPGRLRDRAPCDLRPACLPRDCRARCRR